ncbi:MAG: BrnT family toxin [Nitrospiria bacterium]
MDIIWNPKKAQMNLRAHGIEFPHAATVLDDPLALTIEDARHNEQRFVTIGTDILGRILLVVYAYDDFDNIRLISARKVSPSERRQYEKK